MGWTQTRRIYNDGYTTKREEILAEFNNIIKFIMYTYMEM